MSKYWNFWIEWNMNIWENDVRMSIQIQSIFSPQQCKVWSFCRVRLVKNGYLPYLKCVCDAKLEIQLSEELVSDKQLLSVMWCTSRMTVMKQENNMSLDAHILLCSLKEPSIILQHWTLLWADVTRMTLVKQNTICLSQDKKFTYFMVLHLYTF